MAKKKYNVIREDMLQVASNVAQEKNIDQDSVFSAMEQALEKAARVKYGQEIDIRISIDRSTGDIKLNSYLEVVENIEEESQGKRIISRALIPFIRPRTITVTGFCFRPGTKIHAFFDQEWPGVIRAKGFFWIASNFIRFIYTFDFNFFDNYSYSKI